jgi:hypothetical protein
MMFYLRRLPSFGKMVAVCERIRLWEYAERGRECWRGLGVAEFAGENSVMALFVCGS